MVSLNDLRAQLGLPPEPLDTPLFTLNDALRELPALPLARLRLPFFHLLAQALLPYLSGLNELLSDLERSAAAPQPEAAIASWLADVGGAQVTVRSSWGDIVAQNTGQATNQSVGEPWRETLVYEGRLVGQLEVIAPVAWHPLAALATRQLRQARLQAAAAGAARRRIGERQFEALLAGDSSGSRQAGPCSLAVLRPQQPTRTDHEHEHDIRRLDTLCAVGEGYFHGRNITCLSTVRGDKILWMWQSQSLEQEAQGLLQALQHASKEVFFLGVSGIHSDFAQAPQALQQATQAINAGRPRQLAFFQGLDPLQEVLHSGVLSTLSQQLRTQLHAEDDDGKLESTLRQYLLHHGSLAELANLLGLHVNTVRYRLRRAEEILGGELSDPAFVTRLYLAFYAQGAAGTGL